MTGSNQVNVEIVVQPPPTVGVNRWLVPPVVARTRDAQLVEDYLNGAKHVFATATLYASNMDDYSSALGGNWNVSAQLVTENAAPSRGGGEQQPLGEPAMALLHIQPGVGRHGGHVRLQRGHQRLVPVVAGPGGGVAGRWGPRNQAVQRTRAASSCGATKYVLVDVKMEIGHR